MFTTQEINNFKRIGNGCYAVAYEHPSDPTKVIKVLGYKTKYIQFMSYYLNTLNSYKNWAKIYDLKVPTRKDGQPILIQERIDKVAHSIPKFNLQNEMKKDPDLKFFFWLLRDIANRHDIHADLHSGNYGRRKDGTIAVFDPFS